MPDFTPDFQPWDDQQLAAHGAQVEGQGPRLASLGMNPDESWLAWHRNYAVGRRDPEADKRQIARWAAFKAGHGSLFARNPTPRRGFALMNWAIDPLKLVDESERESVSTLMAQYKAEQEAKWQGEQVKTAEVEAPRPEPKQADATISRGSLLERGTANTVGRLGSILSGIPLIAGYSALEDPGSKKNRQQHIDTVRLLEKARPEQLGDVAVRLGGTDVLSDLGRVWTNKRTGPLGKVLGTVKTPLAAILGNLFRMSHYNPEANSLTQYINKQPVTEHELGHAIDLNDVGGPVRNNFWKRQLHGTKRDLYTLLYQPILNLWHEGQANRKSELALADALKDKPDELVNRQVDRYKVLPGAFSTYATGPFLGPMGTLGAAIGTRAITNLTADDRRDQLLENRRQGKRPGGLSAAMGVGG